MKIGKIKMFFLFNGLIAAGLLIYFGIWMLGPKVTGEVVGPYRPNTITVSYMVNGETYSDSHMRNGIEYRQRQVSVRCFVFDPSISRINSFMGIFAEPLAWWLVFFIASAMLLLTNNTVFSKGTMFCFQKKFPWIYMEEFFQLPWYYTGEQNESSSAGSNETEPKE